MQRRNRTRVGIGAAAAVAMVAATTWIATPASAQQTTDDDTIIAEVEVQEGLTIAIDEESFQLAGFPGELVTSTVVNFTVATNLAGTYSVVVSATGDMVPDDTIENEDVIPFSSLFVEDAETPGSYTAVTENPEVVTEATAGDDYDHTYQIEIPEVEADTYTGTVTYTASADL